MKNKEKKEKKIIKRNWKKITIISVIVFILLGGLITGLVFLFLPDKLDLRSDYLNEHRVSIKTAKKEIAKKEKNVGLFFYDKNSDDTNFLTYGNKSGKKANYDSFLYGGTGPFSFWVQNKMDKDEEKTMVWYAIDINSSSTLTEDLFLTQGTESNTYQINTDIVANPDEGEAKELNDVSKDDDSNWDNDSNKIAFSAERSESDDNNKKYNYYGVYKNNISGSNSDASLYKISDGTIMYFDKDNGLKGITKCKTDTDIESDVEGETLKWFSNYFDSFIEN